MAPRHTRIVSLLLLLTIHAVGVLSVGTSSSSSSGGGGGSGSGSDYVKVRAAMLDKAEKDQIAALSHQGVTYMSRGLGDYSHIPSFNKRALALAEQLGVKYVGQSDQKLYFYSIIQPHTDLGKDMGFKQRLGKDGYVSVLWEHNKDWDKPSIFAVTRVKPLNKVENPPFNWKMDPLEEVLNHIPK